MQLTMATPTCSSQDVAKCIPDTSDVAVNMLQHQSAAHRAKAATATASATATAATSGSHVAGPILMPMQYGLEPYTWDSWPQQVNKDPKSLTTEKVCMSAFQSAYDCQFIPREFGGATCTCLDDVANTWNCPTWYSTMLWGTWYWKPTNMHTVPMGFDKVNETKAICEKAFQQSFDCTEIDMYEGGGKGSCLAGYCQRWWNMCLSDGDPEKDAPHKNSVMPEVMEMLKSQGDGDPEEAAPHKSSATPE